MSAFGLSLIPYFTAYLIHYFITQKLGVTTKNRFRFLDLYMKNTLKKICNLPPELPEFPPPTRQ